MGWGPGKFFRLPLRKEGGATSGRDDLGDLSRFAVQSAPKLRHLAVCNAVRADRGGDGEYVQEIPVKLKCNQLGQTANAEGVKKSEQAARPGLARKTTKYQGDEKKTSAAVCQNILHLAHGAHG